MKQFLYLDTDIVNSIIAQSEKGLVKEQSKESANNTTKSSNAVGSIANSGIIGGSFFKLAKAEANLTISGELGKEYSSGTTSREIISKVLHDAAFDIAYKYISPKNFENDNTSSNNYGDYVDLTRSFNFVDLDYLENLFSKNGLMDLMKIESREKIEAEIKEYESGLNREQLRSENKQIKIKRSKLIADSDKEFDNMYNIILAFRKLMPYTRMLISDDGYLVPLDDKYFRINPESLGFKYGGEITCVGMITNVIGKNSDPNDSENIFATLQFNVNEVLRGLLPTDEENLYVIHPIAIFYGN